MSNPSHTSNVDRFRDALLAVLRREIVDPSGEQLPPIMADDAKDSILHNLSRDQRLIADMFWGCVEIWECQEAARDIEIYLSRTPYTRLGVSKARYLKYHVTNYLNEIYMLRERIEAFTKTIERKYKQNPAHELAEIAQARQKALTELDGLVSIRGRHVHRRRFTTRQLHRLTGFELLLDTTEVSERSRLAGLVMHEYLEQRSWWKEFVQKANGSADALVDQVFTALYPMVFTPEGGLRVPRHWPDA